MTPMRSHTASQYLRNHLCARPPAGRGVLWKSLAWLGASLMGLCAGLACAEPYQAEELLALPDVQSYVSSGDGDVAWVERSHAVRTILVARAPAYRTQVLIRYEQDDGIPLRVIGFGSTDEVVYVRGRRGFNPAHAPISEPVQVLAVAEDKKPRQILGELPAGVAAIALSHDAKRLLLAQGGLVKAVNIEAGGAPETLFTVRGSVTSIVPSADGQRLAFVSDRSGYQRGKYAFAGVYHYTSERVTYLEPGLGVDQDLVWSPDSRSVAFIRFGYEPKTWRFSDHREGAPFDVMVVDANTGRGGAVFTSDPGYGSRFNGLSANGYSGLGGRNSLLWLADGQLVFPYEKTGWKHLYAIPATGGDLTQLTRGAFEVHAMAASLDRRTVHVLANSEGDLSRLGLYRLSLNAELQLERVSVGSEGTMPFTVKPLAGGGVVYEVAGSRLPERLLLAPVDKAPRQLSTEHDPSVVIPGRFPAPEIVEFKARDGLTIQMVLYRPAEVAAEGAHAAVVHSHGGPRGQARPVWRTDFSYRTVLPYLASQGYFVFSVNFRAGTGYGLDFREPESYGGRGAGDVYDFIDAAAFIKDNFAEVDPDRIAIYGHSYGGHNVTNALARSDAYVAGISSAGVGDWVTEMEKDFGEVLQFGIPERLKLEQRAFDSSAISKIDAWGNEPLLLLHGDNDRSAAMQQSLELYTALRRRGKTVEAVVFPGEAHQIKRYESRLRYLEAIDDFLGRHLGPPVVTR